MASAPHGKLVTALRMRYRRGIGVVMLSLAVIYRAAPAMSAGTDSDAPSRHFIFLQAGVAESQTHSYLFGTAWQWRWSTSVRSLLVTGYSELALGRWTTQRSQQVSSPWVTQVAVTPVFRFQPEGSDSPWFMELGVGGNLILPLFHNERKRFSTEFNFGDHLGVGRFLTRDSRQALTLRVQHFSNAGIRHPNPGENFVQLRYAYRLGGAGSMPH